MLLNKINIDLINTVLKRYNFSSLSIDEVTIENEDEKIAYRFVNNDINDLNLCLNFEFDIHITNYVMILPDAFGKKCIEYEFIPQNKINCTNFSILKNTKFALFNFSILQISNNKSKKIFFCEHTSSETVTNFLK